jgi:NADPH-dependent 2,4-dienoyl-CoA reductase/sulfur reductase-like enzyme
VVIVGGGWGGLATAHALRRLAPELDITLLERNAAFWSCPLSNHWLVGRLDTTLLSRDYAAAASAQGYRFIQAEATAIDRDKRRIITTAGTFAYDWLVLSVGIRHDYTAWFGSDRRAAEMAQTLYPAAYTQEQEFTILRDKLMSFKGGNLLMTVPPAPYRCPPAVFERAVLMAGWLESRKIPGHLVIIDPNPPFQEFQRASSIARRHRSQASTSRRDVYKPSLRTTTSMTLS